MYSIFKKVSNLGSKTYGTLYDSYVDPIMHYASGVWGFKDFPPPRVLQNRIMRFFLGVHRFAPVAATKIEFDWLECQQRRWINMIRLFNRINTMDASRLPKIILDWDVSLNLNTWGSEVKRIAFTLGMEPIQADGGTYSLTNIYNACLEYNRTDWKTEAALKPKLRTYNKIHDFDTKQLLVSANVSRYQRSILTQLKFGILPLKIETDRYQGIPAENRLCKICHLNVPEDERPFIFTCPALELIRQSQPLSPMWTHDISDEVLMLK